MNFIEALKTGYLIRRRYKTIWINPDEVFFGNKIITKDDIMAEDWQVEFPISITFTQLETAWKNSIENSQSKAGVQWEPPAVRLARELGMELDANGN